MMQGEGSHTFFVVRQSLGGRTSADIPKSDGLVVGASDYLGFIILTKDSFYSIRVSSEAMNLCLRPHVPDTSCSISTTCHKDIELWMKSQRIDAAEMAVIMSDNLILLEVPAQYLFVLATREQVRVP
jgi:hypothetical protein